jgi:hypothetical protein
MLHFIIRFTSLVLHARHARIILLWFHHPCERARHFQGHRCGAQATASIERRGGIPLSVAHRTEPQLPHGEATHGVSTDHALRGSLLVGLPALPVSGAFASSRCILQPIRMNMTLVRSCHYAGRMWVTEHPLMGQSLCLCSFKVGSIARKADVEYSNG